MTHLGILTAGAAIGPLNIMLPLGQELQRRGHRVTLFRFPDAQPRTEAAGIAFTAIGATELPVGSNAESRLLQGAGITTPKSNPSGRRFSPCSRHY